MKALPEPSRWADSLPLVLLGIRTAFKEDLGCTCAELVYGTMLRLPGEFFTDTHMPIEHGPYVTQLKSTMQRLKAVPPRQPRRRKTHVSDDLSMCPYVFVRHDAVRKPLQPPYDGPYRVLKRSTKHFTIDRSGQQEVVSIDRLKPARLESELPTPQPQLLSHQSTSLPAPQAPRVTRSGRHVHWPERLVHFI